jgi:NADH:ubiquinone oxidoreductase subunit F (NADH-binding)
MTMTEVVTDRLLQHRSGSATRTEFAEHVAIHGPLRVPTHHDQAWSDQMLKEMALSGLRGRGGAGFPTATKWDAISSRSRRPLLVVNAMEGEPASAKDQVLCSYSPHLVLDGAYVAAAVIGASDVMFCIPADRDAPAAIIKAAIEERAAGGHSRPRYSVVRPPAGYVGGEESALVSWLDGRPALPVMRVDKSVPLRANRRSTLVQNAETLSQVALIARYGAAWFRQAGTTDAPGTTLLTVTGAVHRAGVIEVAMGTPVLEILARTGVDTRLGGVLIGGYGGSWLHPTELTTPYAPGPLAAMGATLGVGIMVALPLSSCGVAETARIVRYMAGQSAGQCGPCVFGLPAIADDLELLWTGRADQELLARLERRVEQVDGRGACRHPDGVARLVRSALKVFGDDVRAHSEGRPCAGHRAATVMSFPVMTDLGYRP